MVTALGKEKRMCTHTHTHTHACTHTQYTDIHTHTHAHNTLKKIEKIYKQD